MEQSIKYLTDLYLVFEDFEKGFDSINRNKGWEVMNRYGMPQHITNLIKKLYEVNTCQVVHEDRLSDTIAINTAVSQGSVLCPIIFLMVMDDVMNKMILWKKEIN
jgi:hypothetical protein